MDRTVTQSEISMDDDDDYDDDDIVHSEATTFASISRFRLTEIERH